MAVAAATKVVVAKPSPAELIGRAEKIALLAREQAVETERNRSVSPALIAAMREAGLFRIMQPEAFDGFEYGYDVFVDCVAAISAGDGSIGWVYSLGAVHPWMFAGLPLETQHEIWDDNRDAIAAVSYAPTGTAEAVDGGYRLSGRWSFASGCDNADWAIVSAPMPRRRRRQGARIFFLPRRDVTIHDDWFTMGLAGTGSKSFVIDNAFVPHHRTEVIPDLLVGNPPGAAVNRNPLYRQPFLSVVPTCLVAPQIGMARGALDVFVEQVKSRRTRGAVAGGGNSMADFTAVQMRVAEAAACIDAATLLLHRDLQETAEIAARRRRRRWTCGCATGATIPSPRSCRCRRSMRCSRRRAAPALACSIRCSASGATFTPRQPISASIGMWSAPCTASTSSGWSRRSA